MKSLGRGGFEVERVGRLPIAEEPERSVHFPDYPKCSSGRFRKKKMQVKQAQAGSRYFVEKEPSAPEGWAQSPKCSSGLLSFLLTLVPIYFGMPPTADVGVS